MKVTTWVLATIALLFTVFAAVPASAGTHHSHHVRPAVTGSLTGHQHSCSYKYDWAVNQGGVPEAQADWEINTCGYTMQVKAVCIYIPTGHVDTTYSGEVHGLEVVNKAVCPNPTQLFKLAAGLIDLKDTNSWHQFWPTSSATRLQTAL